MAGTLGVLSLRLSASSLNYSQNQFIHLLGPSISACLISQALLATNPFYSAVGPLIGLTMHHWASGPGHFTTQAPFLPYRCTSTKGSAKFSLLLHHQNTAQLGMPPCAAGRMSASSPSCTTTHSSIAGCRTGLAIAKLARHNRYTLTAGPAFSPFCL